MAAEAPAATATKVVRKTSCDSGVGVGEECGTEGTLKA